jgi:nucleoside-diphosphate-sugar epimerase
VKRALVCGAGGFIGGHLVERLKADGYWVRGVDVKMPEFRETVADSYELYDLRYFEEAVESFGGQPVDEVYQLAADMGGMGFISTAECEIMANNAEINLNMISETVRHGVLRYFFSSSVCVYRDMAVGEAALTEDDAYPAQPDNEYGWEKLYAERMALAYGRKYGMQVRIARFQNTYGPFGTWTGGREKAPAAMCRKVAEAQDGGEIEVWGDGTAVRNYTYVSDLVDGIVALMRSDEQRPCNIGSQEYVSVDDLVRVVADVAGKRVRIKHVPGPVGVQSRNFSTARIEALGWRPEVTLRDGIAQTYPWIAEQVRDQ